MPQLADDCGGGGKGGGGAGGPDCMCDSGGGGGGGGPPPADSGGGGGGGGGHSAGRGGGGGGMVLMALMLLAVSGATDWRRLVQPAAVAAALPMSPRQCGHVVNLVTLVLRSSRCRSSRVSSSVARCTRFSAVSQIRSLIGSLGSMRSRCCSTLRNGIACGVSVT